MINIYINTTKSFGKFLTIVHRMRYIVHRMGRKRIGGERSVLVSFRIPGEWWAKLVGMADGKNPVRELLRDAVRRFIRA